MTTRWARTSRAAAVELGGDLLLVARDGVVRRLEGDTAELARVVLACLAEPRTSDEVLAHVNALAGAGDQHRAVVEQLLALLAETGASASAAEAPPTSGANVVVCVSGAIAATHAPALVTALQRRGHAVEVALTPTAARFVSIDALAAILQREPHTSLWPRAAHAPVPHVALAEWADVVVIYPASATTIARIANGDFSDLVAATALATRAPVVIAPSMNAAMHAAPAVQRNLDRLRDDGHAIVLGAPSHEIADAPALRTTVHGAAPAPGELAATLDALRAGGLLRRREPAPPTARDWDAAYRRPLVPWTNDVCDRDLAEALAEHAPSPRRVLDVGCGLGQVARHAAANGHRVVAIDISEVALALARTRPGGDSIVWLRDDICAPALAATFDAIVDRATLHALPRDHAAAWAASIRRLAAPGAALIVKCHGWSARELAALLPDFELVAEHASELPGVTDPAPIPALLAVLRHSTPR
jgi:SAM-dependent methyltransferase/3-polyprenyl-4-hydroxybenzoate decarboxylase